MGIGEGEKIGDLQGGREDWGFTRVWGGLGIYKGVERIGNLLESSKNRSKNVNEDIRPEFKVYRASLSNVAHVHMRDFSVQRWGLL